MISPWFITYYLLSIGALTSTLIVLYHIVRYRLWNSEINQLVLYLHVTSMGLTIATQPYIYLGNESICEMMRFFHYYGGLTNVCVLTGLTYVYYNFMLNRTTANEKVEKYAGYYIFIFPLIVLLPFTTHSYDHHSGDWCVLDIYNLELQMWAFTIFYFWALLALIGCAAVFTYIFMYAMHRDISTSRRLFQSVGLYMIVGWLTLLPRCVDHIVLLISYSETVDWIQFVTLGPIPISAILYSFIFFFNYQSYRSYSTHHASSLESRKLISLQHFSFRFSMNNSFLSFRSSHSKIQKDLFAATTGPEYLQTEMNRHIDPNQIPTPSIQEVKNPITEEAV